MGLVGSIIIAIIAFELDSNLNVDAIYKIMFISQFIAGMLSLVLAK